jgi:hypothetical protein
MPWTPALAKPDEDSVCLPLFNPAKRKSAYTRPNGCHVLQHAAVNPPSPLPQLRQLTVDRQCFLKKAAYLMAHSQMILNFEKAFSPFRPQCQSTGVGLFLSSVQQLKIFRTSVNPPVI